MHLLRNALLSELLSAFLSAFFALLSALFAGFCPFEKDMSRYFVFRAAYFFLYQISQYKEKIILLKKRIAHLGLMEWL